MGLVKLKLVESSNLIQTEVIADGYIATGYFE